MRLVNRHQQKPNFRFFGIFFIGFRFFRFFQYRRRCRFRFFKISRYRFRFSVTDSALMCGPGFSRGKGNWGVVPPSKMHYNSDSVENGCINYTIYTPTDSVWPQKYTSVVRLQIHMCIYAKMQFERRIQGGYIFYAGGSLAGAGYCRQCRQRPAILPLQLWQGCQVCMKISAQRLPRVAQFYAC